MLFIGFHRVSETFQGRSGVFQRGNCDFRGVSIVLPELQVVLGVVNPIRGISGPAFSPENSRNDLKPDETPETYRYPLKRS